MIRLTQKQKRPTRWNNMSLFDRDGWDEITDEMITDLQASGKIKVTTEAGIIFTIVARNWEYVLWGYGVIPEGQKRLHRDSKGYPLMDDHKLRNWLRLLMPLKLYQKIERETQNGN